MLRLVGASAYRSFRNLWLLEELGVAYEHLPSKPRSHEAQQHNPAFSKIPVLHEGDFSMYESAAINTYLADKFRGREGVPDFVPAAGTPSRGRYEQIVHTLQSELDAQGLWIHRKHEALKGLLAPAAPEAVAHARSHAHKVVAVMTGVLHDAGGEHLLGDFGMSAADMLFVHCLNWGEGIGWFQPFELKEEGLSDTQMAELKAYLARCRARPAYLRAKELP